MAENKPGVLKQLKGIVADFKHPTRNNRKYTKELWEEAFQSPLVRETMDAGGFLVQLGHPADEAVDEINWKELAGVIPELPEINDDGTLVAVVDLLDTPQGRIANTLANYGYKLGISSRGNGDVIEDIISGEEVVDPDSFDLITWDLVATPALKGARLTPVTESLKKNKNKMKALKEELDSEIENIEDDEEKESVIDFLNDLMDFLKEKKEEKPEEEEEEVPAEEVEEVVTDEEQSDEELPAEEVAEEEFPEENEVPEGEIPENEESVEDEIPEEKEKEEKPSDEEDEVEEISIDQVHIEGLDKDKAKKEACDKEEVKEECTKEECEKEKKFTEDDLYEAVRYALGNSKFKDCAKENKALSAKVEQLTSDLKAKEEENTNLNTQLTEALNKVDAHKKVNDQLKEAFKHSRNQLSNGMKKVKEQDKLIEELTNRYISLKADMLDVDANTLMESIGDNISINFLDKIDRVANRLTNVKKLPFATPSTRTIKTKSLNEDINYSKVVNNNIDDVDDFLEEICKLY